MAGLFTWSAFHILKQGMAEYREGAEEGQPLRETG